MNEDDDNATEILRTQAMEDMFSFLC